MNLRNYIKKIISNINNLIFNILNIFILVRPDLGLGDQLCMTIAISSIKKRYPKLKIIVLTKFPEVFYKNKNIFSTIDLKKWPKKFRDLFWDYFSIVEGKRIEFFGLKEEGSLRFTDIMRNNINKEHLAIVFSKHFESKISYPESLKPEIYLTEQEKNIFKNSLNLPEKFAVIHSEGFLNHLPIKEWGKENMQKVVGLTNDIVCWIQVGMKDHALLDNVIDLRGRTNFRELAYAISKALFVLSTEGLYNHIAAAFNIPSIVVFSGFHYKEIACYSNTIPIISYPLPDCAPCWIIGPCPKSRKICMENISPEAVKREIHKIVSNSKKQCVS
jgi:ADP-heptose:LPS heptosyltransferase